MDELGNIIANCSQPYRINFPMEGYAEQSPDIWWESCVNTIRESILLSNINPEDIRGIGLSGQMHGCITIDQATHPIRPAIIHCDQRADKEVHEIIDMIGRDHIEKRIMNPIFSGFQLVSLYWMKKHERDDFNKIHKVLPPKDYLRLRLTGEFCTDYSDASGTLALDITTREWNYELLEKLGIPADIFPRCVSSCKVAGQITREASEATGLKVGTPVVGGGADQVTQAIGNGVILPGDATVAIGTSGQVVFPVNTPVLNKALNTHIFCGALPGKWFIMGAMLNAGLCLDWFIHKVFPESGKEFPEVVHQVEKTKRGSEGVIFLPYLTGERTPHMSPYPKGIFWGLTINTRYENLCYAVMEGVAFALKECLDLCEGLSAKADRIVATGGGTKSAVWLQILSDVFGRELYTTRSQMHACVGAAIPAGVGTGVYKSIEEGCSKAIKICSNPVIPDCENTEKYLRKFALYKQIYLANAPLFQVMRRSVASS